MSEFNVCRKCGTVVYSRRTDCPSCGAYSLERVIAELKLAVVDDEEFSEYDSLDIECRVLSCVYNEKGRCFDYETNRENSDAVCHEMGMKMAGIDCKCHICIRCHVCGGRIDAPTYAEDDIGPVCFTCDKNRILREFHEKE